MTPQDARTILGLSSTADLSSSLATLEDARNRIAAMVESAPDKVLADRYRQGLEEFETALATLRVEKSSADLSGPRDPSAPLMPPKPSVGPTPSVDEASKLKSPVTETDTKTNDGKPVSSATPAATPAAVLPVAEVTKRKVVEPVKPGRGLSYLVWLLVVCVGVGGGFWWFQKEQQAKREAAMTRVEALERQGAVLIENRNWQEAKDTFAEIESLIPGSEIAKRARNSIEVGMAEEQTQFLGYWIGQAMAELEAGRLVEAEAASHKVRERFPNDSENALIIQKIAAARETQALDAAIAVARDELSQRKFDAAIASAEKILLSSPDDADAKTILDSARLARAKAAADRELASGLFRKAAERDAGKFDQQALEWIREAASLSPDDTEIAAMLEKLSSYTRALQVPGEFATLDEALASARARDTIVVAAGTWTGPLVVDVEVEIRGAGAGETIVECSAENGSAFTVGPDAKGVIVSGITFRQQSFAAGNDRFSAVLVRGGEATFSDCVFTLASGHGLAVIEGGRAIVSRCKSTENGWNGVAAIGKDSTLEVRESEAIENFEHGIESWDGAAVVLVNNRCQGNSRNGVHVDNGSASAEITGNQLIANREFGLVLDSAGSGEVTKNVCRDNLLGGMVIRAAAQAVRVTDNQATANQGPGLVLEKGLASSSYQANTMTKNSGQQLLAGMDFDVTVKSSPAVTTPAESLATPPGMTRGATTTPANSPAPPRAKIVIEP